MIRKTAVELAEKRQHFTTEFLEQLHGNDRGGPVATVDHQFQRRFHQHIVEDRLAVVAVYFGDAVTALTLVVALPGNALAQIRYPLAAQRLAVDHDLEAVVIGRVVAAGHHDTAHRVQVMAGEIEHRRWHRTRIDHIDAAGEHSLNQVFAQQRAAFPCISCDHHRGHAAIECFRCDGLSDGMGKSLADLAGASADIVIAEYLRRDLQRRIAFETNGIRIRFLQFQDFQRVDRTAFHRRFCKVLAGVRAVCAAQLHQRLAKRRKHRVVQRGHCGSGAALVKGKVFQAQGVFAQLHSQLAKCESYQSDEYACAAHGAQHQRKPGDRGIGDKRLRWPETCLNSSHRGCDPIGCAFIRGSSMLLFERRQLAVRRDQPKRIITRSRCRREEIAQNGLQVRAQQQHAGTAVAIGCRNRRRSAQYPLPVGRIGFGPGWAGVERGTDKVHLDVVVHCARDECRVRDAERAESEQLCRMQAGEGPRWRGAASGQRLDHARAGRQFRGVFLQQACVTFERERKLGGVCFRAAPQGPAFERPCIAVNGTQQHRLRQSVSQP